MGDIQPISKERTKSTNSRSLNSTNLLDTMKKLADASVTFFESVTRRVHIKTLKYLLSKMTQQRQKLLRTLQNYQQSVEPIAQQSDMGSANLQENQANLNDSPDHQLAETHLKAIEVIRWYTDNQQRDINQDVEEFIDDLQNNERQFIHFYRSRIKQLKPHQLVSVMASNLASIQITYDKMKGSQFESGFKPSGLNSASTESCQQQANISSAQPKQRKQSNA